MSCGEMVDARFSNRSTADCETPKIVQWIGVRLGLATTSPIVDAGVVGMGWAQSCAQEARSC